ncbi:phage tail protein [Paenibacillus polymyxa]|uniref:phage tail protein n=1 Tax=Paenibacillus polymyxa TaxID=1406 RepID=UPI002AB4CDBD|nr:phage tail protein [Paenibacillus polymyxa]MDY7990692.1 phage tail protein [Paenibacillus polymyxa]MDY8117496.1 phage tail protein [Paenibacillus polymyxa]
MAKDWGGLATLGDIVFIVTHYKIRTFSEFKRTTNDRWGANEIIGKKPRSQYLGPGLDSIDLTVRVDASYGMNPREEVEKLVEYSRKGKVMPFIIGKKGLGVKWWKITGLTQNWENVNNKGQLVVATYNLTLEEYV